MKTYGCIVIKEIFPMNLIPYKELLVVRTNKGIELPKGKKSSPTETGYQAAERETFEETGINVSPLLGFKITTLDKKTDFYFAYATNYGISMDRCTDKKIKNVEWIPIKDISLDDVRDYQRDVFEMIIKLCKN